MNIKRKTWSIGFLLALFFLFTGCSTVVAFRQSRNIDLYPEKGYSGESVYVFCGVRTLEAWNRGLGHDAGAALSFPPVWAILAIDLFGSLALDTLLLPITIPLESSSTKEVKAFEPMLPPPPD